MKSEKKLEQAIALSKREFTNIEVANYILGEIAKNLREFLIDNEKGCGKAKRDMYALVCGEKAVREIMKGVYHDPEGWAVASDTVILVASKDDYKEEFAGKVIDKYGNEKEGRYPNWKMVMPNDTWKRSHAHGVEMPSMDLLNDITKRFKAFQKVHADKRDKGFAAVNINGVFVNINFAIKLRAWTDVVTCWYNDDGTGHMVSFENDTCKGVAMAMQFKKEYNDCVAVFRCNGEEERVH